MWFEPPWQGQIQHLCAVSVVSVQMSLIGAVDHDIAGTNADAPAIARLFIPTGEHERHIAFRVPMTAKKREALSVLPPEEDWAKTAHDRPFTSSSDTHAQAQKFISSALVQSKHESCTAAH